jgi:hypothetical protein
LFSRVRPLKFPHGMREFQGSYPTEQQRINA